MGELLWLALLLAGPRREGQMDGKECLENVWALVSQDVFLVVYS